MVLPGCSRHLSQCLLVGALAACVGIAADKSPLQLKSLSITPDAINTSQGSAPVTIQFQITDESSGVTRFEASFADPSGVFRQSGALTFPAAASASNSLKINFPRFATAGTWSLTHVFASDVDGNTLVLDSEELARRGVPTHVEVTSTRDSTSPQITAVEFSTMEVDTTSGPFDLKINVSATDDLSGISYIELSAVSPSGAANRNGTAKFDPVLSTSKSITLNFPQVIEPGQWTLKTAFLADAAGNTLILDTDGIVRLGFPTTFMVKSLTDMSPPSLTSLHFSSDTIDTSSGDAEIFIDFTATDDVSGVTQVEASFVSPSGTVHHSGAAKVEHAKSAFGTIAVTFPRGSEAGQWILNSVFLSDAAGNTTTLDADALASKVPKLQVH